MSLFDTPSTKCDVEGAGQRKTLAPFLNIEEGTRVVCLCYTRGATPIVFQSLAGEMPLTGDALAYCIVARVERPLYCRLLYCVGTAHLYLLAPGEVRCCILAAGFLRSAAHEGVLRGRISIPNFHSVSDRCRFPLSYSVRSTRVSVSKLSLLSIPVDL